ncbi:MAG: Type secretion system protein [Pedosphaera sp.]|nr:Type secretion system protein [Pedosphaera sp.]
MSLIITPGQLSKRAQFYRQLGQLTSAGIGIINAFEMLHANPPDATYRKPTRELITQLSGGATVTEAVRHLGHWMPALDIALVGAGEKSGRIDAVFKLLANFYDDRARMLRQMISALWYPAFVFHFAIILFPFLAFFSDGNWIVFLAKTLGIFIPLYCLVLLMIYASRNRRGASWRSVLEMLLRPVPVLGTARQYLALARLSVALEALLNAGVTIIEAWEMAATASGSPAILRTVTAWKPAVVGGQTPSEAINASGSFPDVFANLYHSGEVSGQLDDSLRRLHDYYQEEGSRKLNMFARVVPKAVYFAVAFLVGFKVIAFYSNYFNQLNEIMKP